MDQAARVALLKKLDLFDQYGEERLRALAGHLEPLAVADGAKVFEEGTPGDGLYFVVEGRARMAKRLAGGGEKDLAVVGPGDCFGEMALLDAAPRSATAYAAGPLSLLRLQRDALKSWLAQDAASAMDFFAELVGVQSRRLRRTSSELALLHDLTRLLVEAPQRPADLLREALARVLPHLAGDWSATAFAWNPFNEEYDDAAALGPESAAIAAAREPSSGEPAWTGARELDLPLRARERRLALLRLRAGRDLTEGERAEDARLLSAVARLLASALENLDHRADEALRQRLRKRSDAQGF